MRLMGSGGALSGLGACLAEPVGLLHLLRVQAVYCLLLKALEVFGVLLVQCHRWIRNCCYGRFSGAGVAAAGGAAYLGMHADDKITAGMSKSDIYKKSSGQSLTNPAC